MLYVVATPLGNSDDIGQRARKIIEDCDLIIGEEAKELRARLKQWGLSPQKEMRLLNEHSIETDIHELLELCRNQTVALVSDCGTPGFFDPGPELVTLARKAGVPVKSVPGPSSIAAFISVSGYRFNEFYFAGFLPAKEEQRAAKWQQLTTLKVPIFVMDTPYRFKKIVPELKRYFLNKSVIIGCDLSTDQELIKHTTIKSLDDAEFPAKPEFILAILPS
jgi:16S rRNA (cytidine1402-2'-O)-methyltransferase